MCGICGVWEYGATEGRVDTSLVRRMRDVMAHRGPDDTGELIFDNGRGGLGFRRLSIIDLSVAGHQPMHGCDDRRWIVFNGEVYNHLELRKGLESRGHRYSSQTDTETILHLYEEKGVDLVHQIEGDYGIAIWDADREELFLARDRIGVKPLYYYHQEGRFIFGSEIKAILQHPAVTPEIEEELLYHYLTFLTTPAPRTLFKNIHKLPAGYSLVLNRHGNLRISQYWDALPPEKPKVITQERQEEEILSLLRSSIKKRMMSDVPFGVFLSGGVDSSANVALMSELMSQPVRTFTVGFRDNEELNELEPARAISKRFGTDHHEVIIGGAEMERFLLDLAFYQDEPVADPVCIPLYYVSKLARESGTVVIQVGEGSDEIFAGYEWFGKYLRLNEKLWKPAQNIPLAARRAVATLTIPLMEKVFHRRTAADLMRRLGAGEALFWGGAVVYDEALKPRVLSEDMRVGLNGLSSYSIVSQYLDHLLASRPGADFAQQMSYLELKLRLPELLLMRVDKMTMATSVEARVPFLDHQLVEYALGISVNRKVEGTNGKLVLKRALEKVLPRELLYSRKRGFGAPIREWFREETGNRLVDRLMNSTLRRRNFFDYSFVARMIDEHRRGTRDWSFHLWCLLNLSLWYECWIEKE
jgi:asparagine synthase (glutamine-hydrolysing)